jgi:uncharacterized protein DUF6719
VKKISIGILAIVAAMTFSSLCNAQVLKKEPGAGQLPAGSVVLVDDGTCGKGKIKQVTAGSNMSGGQMVAGGSPRTRKCIPKS